MNPQTVIQGLIARGMPPHIAQGFAGNFAVESGFNPGINEVAPLVPGSRGGFGLAQWTGPRRRSLEAFAAERGVPVDDMDMQLDFLMSELSGPERASWDAISAATTPDQAARLVSERFLRPGIPHLDRRINAALQFAGMEPQGASTMSMNPDPQPQGLFGGIGQGLRNMFGGGQPDPNAGSATDPFQGLSRAQRTMLGFAALRDAAASLEGRDSNFFNEALGGFEAARERERLRAQGQFANRNDAINNLIQLEALASQLPENSGLQQLVNVQRELLLGQVGLPSGTSVTGMAGAGGATPMPVDFTGGTMPPGAPSGPLGVTGAPETGVVIDPVTGETSAYDGAPETPAAPSPAPAPAATPAAASDDPLARLNAQIAEQERQINIMVENLPDRNAVILGQMSGLEAGVDPRTQAYLDLALQRRNDLIAQRDAFVAGQPDREAAALASEDAARQARYNRGVIQSIINSPNLGGVVGRFEGQADPGTVRGAVLFDEGDLDLLARIDQLQGQVFLEARDMLRGGGQITDFEGIRAQEALSRIGQRGVSEEAYRQALRELDQVFANAEARALGQPVPFPDIDTDPNAGAATGGAGGGTGGDIPQITSDAEYDALPSGTQFLDPDGVLRRKP